MSSSTIFACFHNTVSISVRPFPASRHREEAEETRATALREWIHELTDFCHTVTFHSTAAAYPNSFSENVHQQDALLLLTITEHLYHSMSNTNVPEGTNTTAANERCCDKCDEPRTWEQFRFNHMWLPEHPVEDDAVCAICHEPYGNEDLSNLLVDHACAILGIPQCTHIFGYDCICSMIHFADEDATTRCPLCRTPWWYNEDSGSGPITEQDRHIQSEDWAERCQRDYNTMRWILFQEPDYADAYPPMALEEAAWKRYIFYGLRAALQTLIFEEMIAKLRENCNINTIAEAIFEPYEAMSQPFQLTAVFQFNNYHLQTDRIALAMYHTLSTWRGSRLLDTYRISRKEAVEDEVAVIQAMVESWMATFPDDNESWVSLVLMALWVADPDWIGDEGDEWHDDDEEDGGDDLGDDDSGQGETVEVASVELALSDIMQL
jgi:hypothetical protein